MSSQAPSRIMKKLIQTFFAIIILALLSQSQSYLGDVIPDSLSDKSIPEHFAVTHVVDGDTIDINYLGETKRIRLIGINTPESVGDRAKECFGIEASKRAKELAANANVTLEFDPTQDKEDKYGRMLAYVYLEDGQMLNRKLISEGYGYEYTYMKPYKYQASFRQAQKFAHDSQLGLWSSSTCNGSKSLN